MTQEEKQLLLKDLCARLPYGVKVRRYVHVTPTDAIESIEVFNPYWLSELYSEEAEFKPYLRPMSSMTEEEKEEMKEVIEIELTALEGPEGFSVVTAAPSAFEIDFYNKHHLDYRGLIPMGLALEAPEGMYKIK